jgi:hypothetical protein
MVRQTFARETRTPHSVIRSFARAAPALCV